MFMNTGVLYPLIPKPINVQNSTFSGKLLIDGNLTENLLLFRFLFDTVESVSPLCINIEVLKKSYQYLCDIRDFTNPIMKTQVIKPKFNLKNKVKILKIEPLINLKKKFLDF